MRGNILSVRSCFAALLVAALAMVGCSGGSSGSAGTSSTGGVPLTGTVSVYLTDPTYHFTQDKVRRSLSFTGQDDSGAVSFGPEQHDFQDVVTLRNVPVQTVRIVVDDPTDATVEGEAPVHVNAGGRSYVSDLFLLPVRVGQDGARARSAARGAGDPVQVGAGYIQTKLSAIGNKGANAVMANAKGFAVSNTMAAHSFPFRANSWLAPLMSADNVEKVFLGDDYANNTPRIAWQNAVYPHPWAILFNANPSRGQMGLLLNQERVRIGGSTFVPGPDQVSNSSHLMADINGGFDVAHTKVDPGFQPYALKVHRMGDYDAQLVMRGIDDANLDATGLPKDAALAMTVVRGSPMLYFVSVGLPKVTLFNFWTAANTNASGTVTVSGTSINYTVLSGTTPPDNRMRHVVLFYPAAQARYTPTTVVDSVLTFNDPYNGQNGANYFALCMLPDASFADDTTVQKLAATAFSYPTDSKVTYSYSQATQTAQAAYTLTATNVLNGPVKCLNGLMPHHYLPSPVHNNDAILQGSPTVLTNSAGQALEYLTVRGNLRVYDATRFTCSYPFPGILPWLPPLAAGDAAGRTELHKWIYDAFVAQRGGENPPYTAMKAGVGQDSYTLVKFLGRNVLAAATIADVEGDAALATTIRTNTAEAIATYFRQAPTLIQERNEGQAPYYLYYDPLVGTINLYPSTAAAASSPPEAKGGAVIFPADTNDAPRDGFGTLARCNDHHFHYGYIFYAAGALALRDPAWGAAWKDAINQLVFDVAFDPEVYTSPFRFPKKRFWEPYMNHGQAAGFTWPDENGNNEEAISEHLNFWVGMMQWAAATGQQAMLEQAAAHYSAAVHSSWIYWYDPTDRDAQTVAALSPGTPTNWWGKGACRLFDGQTVRSNFFFNHPASQRGIDMFPLTPGHFYHAMNQALGQQTLAAYDAFVTTYNIDPLHPAGLADWRTTANQWLGTMNFLGIFAKYASMFDPANALTRYYPVTPDYNVVGGIIPWDKVTDPGDSGPFIYHWNRYMQTHGKPDPWVRATNTPFFMTFLDTPNKLRTYAGFNHTGNPLTITFDDGESIPNVAPRTLGAKTVAIP